jgi:alpha-1,3/alpha-1,6-mannosyltransferase
MKYKLILGDQGTLDVRVRGNWLVPQTILGRFWILCAILRQLHLIVQITILSNELRKLNPTTFFVDQLSAGVPLLRLLSPKIKILFYCHFPDKYLAKQGGLIKSLYRIPFDLLESWSTDCSDGIVVNSRFTKGIFAKAFPSLKHRDPKVVYPCVDTSDSTKKDQVAIDGPLWNGDRILLSINRFEKKKDIGLALRAYAKVPAKHRERSRLVIAGKDTQFAV